MTLYVCLSGPDQSTHSGELVLGSADDVVLHSDLLLEAQTRVGYDAKVWVTDVSLLDYIPCPSGGSIEINRQNDPRQALNAAYGQLPTDLGSEMIQRWLHPPYPDGVPLLQLLLARVLALPELAYPGAAPPLTETIQAAAQAGKLLEQPLIHQAWLTYGPVEAVGTLQTPGLLRDPCTATYLLIARLLAHYPETVRTRVAAAVGGVMIDSRDTEKLMAKLETPDPRVLGRDRLAKLDVLLRPELEEAPVDTYLGIVSGRLRVELEVLLERLERGGVGKDLSIEGIRSCFHWLTANDTTASSLLQRFIDGRAIADLLASHVPTVGVKTAEEARAGLDVWRSFFISKFLPALYAWRREGRPREGLLARTLFDADARFARWIAAAFPKLKSQPSPSLAYSEIRRWARLASNSTPCIVLLIDGLAYEQVDLLREAAAATGIWLSPDVRPMLASLPTVTNVSMLTAVAGLPVDVAWAEDPSQAERARQRRERLLRQRVPSAVVRTVSQIEHVGEALARPSDLYLLVWSDVDALAHRYGTHAMLTDYARVSLRHILQAIAVAVEAEPHLRQRKDQLRLLISSDHGWTDLLEAEPAPRPIVAGAKSHHRLYEVPREVSIDEIEQLGDDWIVIRGDAYDLPESRTYLVPAQNRAIMRGVNRQHGGLSQCEVLVPLLTGSFARQPFLAPALLLIPCQALQKGCVGDIKVVVSNRNLGDLKNLRVTCRALELRAEITYVPPETSATFGPFAVRPSSSGEIDCVAVQVIYEGESIVSSEIRLEGPLRVEKSTEERMAGDYSGLESLFDELGSS